MNVPPLPQNCRAVAILASVFQDAGVMTALDTLFTGAKARLWKQLPGVAGDLTWQGGIEADFTGYAHKNAAFGYSRSSADFKMQLVNNQAWTVGANNTTNIIAGATFETAAGDPLAIVSFAQKADMRKNGTVLDVLGIDGQPIFHTPIAIGILTD